MMLAAEEEEEEEEEEVPKNHRWNQAQILTLPFERILGISRYFH
jgi:hypothetical protein